MRAVVFSVVSLFVAALGIGCSGGKEKAIAQLESPHAEERASGVERLGKSDTPEDLVRITRLSRDASPLVRREVATALGRSGDPRVIDLLGELLADAEPVVQERAATALATQKQEKARAYLLAQYVRGDREARASIVAALEAANVPGAMATAVAAESKTLWERNLAALTQGTMPERVAAAEELGESGRPEAVQRLRSLVTSSNVLMAAAAVKGLGRAGDARVVEQLTPLLNEKFPELREAAAVALRDLAAPPSLPTLKTLALERSAASPLAAAAIVALPPSDEVRAALCEIAWAGSPNEALASARVVAKRGGCPVEGLASALARGKDSDGVLRAAAALGSSTRPLAARIVALYPSLTTASSRAIAIDAIASGGDTSTLPFIQKVLADESQKLERLRAKWVPVKPDAARTGSAGAAANAQKAQALLDKVEAARLERLQAAGKRPTRLRPPSELVDDVPEDALFVTAAALRGLGRLEATDGVSVLEPYTRDASPMLRRAAWEGLARLGDKGVALAAEGVWEADSKTVEVVARALTESGKPGHRILVDVLEHRSGELVPVLEALAAFPPSSTEEASLTKLVEGGGAEARLAAERLGELKARGSVPVLLRTLTEPTTAARTHILDALGEIGDPSAAEGVAKELFHDNPDVRRSAVAALMKFKSPVGAKSVDALKGDFYLRVRHTADPRAGATSPVR